MHIRVNGEAQATVDALDRGLQYGDGLFETVAVANGRPRFLDWHLERLANGARRLAFPEPDLERLRSEIGEAASTRTAAVKLLLTRGGGERGYRPPRDANPTRIVAAFDGPAAARLPAGARVGWCRTRLGRNPALAGIKHTNRLEQVLARAEWDDGRMDEGLMQDDQGHVICATQANVFARMGGGWVTPALDACGVAGVMRRAFREWLKGQGIPVQERNVSAPELASASALVLTNALIGACTVRELAGRPLEADPHALAFNSWLARL